jgi:hypothetical protein
MPARLLGSLLGVLLTVAAGRPDAPPGAIPAPRPRLVTLRSEKILLSKALAELSRQTGVRVEDRRGQPDVEVRLDLHDVPFWKALDTIADAARASVYLYPRSGSIALVPRTAFRPPISYDGFFRCCLKQALARRDFETGAGSCVVFLEVAWEPDLQPLLLETRPQALHLVDDTGKQIPVPPGGSAMAPVDGRVALVSEVTLPALPRTTRAIGLLEGTLTVVAPTKMLTFAFGDLDKLEKAAPQQQEGVSCRISKVVLARDRWTVQVTLDYPPGNKELESYQSWVVNNELALVSADGNRRFTTRDYILEESSSRRAVISYHFRDKDKQVRGRPEDWRVTYRTPAAIIEWPIHFSFKDVPLP